MKQASGQMSLFDLGMLCGRTSPEPSLPTKEKTSASSSKSFAKLKTPVPLYLDLRKKGGGSGILAEPSWEMGIPSHGGCSMRVFGEFPNVAEESGLWQILEANVPQKYYLSARACAGVLRRAERRGKELPTILKTALEQQIERWEKYGTPLPRFVCNVREKEIYDARGNGDGQIVPTMTGDHNNRITDYTTLVCEKFAENSSGDGISGTIDAHYYLGCGARGGKEREFVCISIDRAAFNQGINAKYDIGIEDSGKTQTITARGANAVCYCLQGNGIDRADTAGCNGKGVKENESYTLNTLDRHAVCYAQPSQETKVKEYCYIVRRLTPLECCRLQGMPDWWCADIPHSDAQEYRMWGNGMALPNALYIMEGLAKSEE